MSGELPDDRRLVDWAAGAGHEAGEVVGPDHPEVFGGRRWTPPLVPLPRRAPDELF